MSNGVKDERSVARRVLEDYFEQIVGIEVLFGFVMIVTAALSRPPQGGDAFVLLQQMRIASLPTAVTTPIPVNTVPPDDMPIQLNYEGK